MHKNDGELFCSKFAEVNKERQCDKALCKKSRKIKKTTTKVHLDMGFDNAS